VIRPTDPTHGRGLRPVLSWPAVAGAASYRVVVLDSGRRPYWAWQGEATSVRVGGAPKRVPRMTTGPRVTKGGAWTVAAFDAAGRPLALSAARPVSP